MLKSKNNTKISTFCMLLGILLVPLSIPNNAATSAEITLDREGSNRLLDNETIVSMIPLSADLIVHAPILIDGHDSYQDWDDCDIVVGSGTFGDPYVIKNLYIDADYSGSCIEIRNIDDAYFEIKNCVILNSQWDSGNAGIKIDNSRNGLVEQNNCTRNNHGIYLTMTAEDNKVTQNLCFENINNGIYIAGPNNIINENNCSQNHYTGIRIDNQTNCIISNNVSFNYNFGIYCYGTNHCIEDNLISYNDAFGIFFYGSGHSIINNNISFNGFYEIYAERATNTVISYNNIQGNEDFGIYLVGHTQNITISHNLIHHHNTGIKIYFGLMHQIINNTISFNGWGLYLDDAYYCDINSNVFLNNFGNIYGESQGIVIVQPAGSIVHDPILIDGSDSTHDWDDCDAVTGSGSLEDPYIIENLFIDAQFIENGIVVRHTGETYFIIRNCTVVKSKWENSFAGIYIQNVRNGQLLQNNCTASYSGIQLFWGTENMNISDNYCDNNWRYGINMLGSNVIVNNNKCSMNGECGIYLKSQNNQITGNNCSFNGNSGIYTSDGDYLDLSYNDIQSNVQYGIYLGGTTQNISVSNNLIRNHDTGIYISGLLHQTHNNNISFNGWGLYLDSAYYCDIGFNEFLNNTNGNIYGESQGISIVQPAGSIVHDPILIDGSDSTHDWDDCDAVTGSGSLEDPYIIENLFIDAQFRDNGIMLRYTGETHFIIKNCTVVKSKWEKFYAGIVIEYCSNGQVLQNNCTASYSGIQSFWGTDNMEISNNYCQNNRKYGIYVEGSNTVVSDNICSMNGDHGIYLNSQKNHISGNNCSFNNNCGICILGPDQSVIDNYCSNNGGYGINSVYGENVNISNNLLINNTYGINLFSTNQNNTITHNTILNSGYGITIHRGGYNRILSNEICFTEYGLGIYENYKGIIENNTFWGPDGQFIVEENCGDCHFLNNMFITLEGFGYNATIIFEGDLGQFLAATEVGEAPYTYLWNFGDGTANETVADPLHFFAEEGTYTVSLNQTDNLGDFYYFSTEVIVQNLPPVAQFETSDTILNMSQLVQFTDTSYSGNAPFTYVWDFDDGSPNSSEQNPMHQFTENGNYHVCLSVKDSDGDWGYAYLVITVLPLTVKIIVEKTTVAMAEEINFTSILYSGNSPFTYEWTFGDESGTSTYQYPTYVYMDSGIYNVTLIVTDSDLHIATTWITIEVVTLTATFEMNKISIYVNDSIQFIDVSFSGNPPYAYEWDFGDGSINSTDQHPIHQFLTPGTFTITLNIWDSDGDWATTTQLITVLESVSDRWTVPEAFEIYLDGNVVLPLKVNNVEIRILQEAFENAETITIYISTTEFTTADIENGNINSITFNATVLGRITPGMINRYQFTGLINGTYYVAVSYSNPLGSAVSNVLEIAVELDESPGNNNNVSIDGYNGMIMVSVISLIGVLWISSRKRRNISH